MQIWVFLFVFYFFPNYQSYKPQSQIDYFFSSGPSFSSFITIKKEFLQAKLDHKLHIYFGRQPQMDIAFNKK